MYYNYSNKVWATSGIGVTISDNTDWSISGTSKKIKFTLSGEYATLTFDAVDVTQFDEVTMQIYTSPNINSREDVLGITINGTEYLFDEQKDAFHHVLFDTEGMNNLSQIRFTAKVDSLCIFVDLVGYRKVAFSNVITDVIEAIASAISIDYNVATTLAANITAGSKQITLASYNNIYNNARLLINNVEEVTIKEITSGVGNLERSITGAYSIGDSVVVLCPVKYGAKKSIVYDPVCGVVLYDKPIANRYVDKKMIQGYSKRKIYLNNLYIMVYLECSNEKKLYEISSQYEFNYGESFSFLLDGEKVFLNSVSSGEFLPDIIGNPPRVTYRYSFEPQPYLFAKRKVITTINLSMVSASA